jgi:hypothetical protein
MIARPKTDVATPVLRLMPLGYQTQPLRKRMTRPLHSRRAAILEAAEAAFKGEFHDVKKLDQQPQDDTSSSTETHVAIEAGRK